MTATERLRAMLDERHVKWHTDTSVTNQVEWTIWKSPWFKEVWAKEVDGSISIFNCSMTPAQAIEATLGRGECQLKHANWDNGTCTWGCICSVCDAHLEHETGIGYNFCPHCGARVVRA